MLGFHWLAPTDLKYVETNWEILSFYYRLSPLIPVIKESAFSTSAILQQKQR